MRKMPKKPKATKPPKKPRASASVTVWENYDKRHKAWQKRERDKLSAWKKKCSAITSGKKKKESLIKKYSR